MGAESSIAAQLCVCVVLLCGSRSDLDGSIGFNRISFMGRLAFPFIGEGKAWVTEEKKEKNEREKKAFRIVGSFSLMRVPPIL